MSPEPLYNWLNCQARENEQRHLDRKSVTGMKRTEETVDKSVATDQ